MRNLAFLSVVALGCSASGGATAPGGPSGGGSGGAGAVSGGGSGGSFIAVGGDTFIHDPGGGAASSGGASNPDEACSAVEQRAERIEGGRADVIIAVDSSGSMGEENAAVQANLNRFSTFIVNAGIDVHVVLISGGNDEWSQFIGIFTGGGTAICLDPPLGAAGACPNGDDTNLPTYMHWRENIGSHDALARIQSTFGGWRGMLRPDAFKTFVVVTDDENSPPPTGPEFSAWVDAQPEFQGGPWRFSGIYCVADVNNCSGAGATYQALVQQTQGITGDLSQFSSGNVDAEFQVVFDQLADLVVAQAKPVDCEWTIPDPPEGEEFDRNAVNVRFTTGAGEATTIYALDGQNECDPNYGGWYYDDNTNPTRVVACPSSCVAMQSDLDGRVEVLFGCARERPPIR